MKKRSILVGEPPESKEVKLLCKRTGIEIEKEIKPSTEKNKTHYLGKGKIEDIRKELEGKERVNQVVVATQLDPSVRHRLQKKINGRLLDRSDIVLKIFEEEGETALVKKQVEKAKLERKMPQLRRKESWEKDYIGPAKKKLKKFREEIKKQEEKTEKATDRVLEKGYPSIALLGYTNAGKSTLFNHLSEKKKTNAENQLFTTKKHTSQILELQAQPTLVTDTLGLFKAIPEELEPAFHSTLYIARKSDHRILLIDASEKQEIALSKFKSSMATLKEVGIEEPIIALNKIDKGTGNPIDIKKEIKKKSNNSIFLISAKTGKNISKMIKNTLKAEKFKEKKFKVHYRENPDKVINELKELPLNIQIDKREKNVIIEAKGKEKPMDKAERIVKDLKTH